MDSSKDKPSPKEGSPSQNGHLSSTEKAEPKREEDSYVACIKSSPVANIV